jgi:hypothetical protein
MTVVAERTVPAAAHRVAAALGEEPARHEPASRNAVLNAVRDEVRS